jgi:Rod binding domain-containing protein
MATGSIMMTPSVTGRFDAAPNLAMTHSVQAKKTAATAKTRENAQEFEAMFLNSMFQHMMTGMDGDGPFGGSKGIGVWRSFLTNEFAKSVARKGGIGLADQVYNSLIQQQAAASSRVAPSSAVRGATPASVASSSAVRDATPDATARKIQPGG